MRIVLAMGTGAAALVIAGRRGRTRSHSLRGTGRFQLPAALRARVTVWLRDAGLDAQPESVIGWWALAVAVAAMLGTALAPAVGLVAALALALGAPIALVATRGRVERRLAGELPEALSRVASDLRAGRTIPSALDELTQGDGPLAIDLLEVNRRRELGAPLVDALAAWATRRDRDDVRVAAGAFAMAATLGGRCAHALDDLAASLREQVGATEEARAQSAQARLSAAVVGGAPLAYFAFATATDPATTAVLVGSRAGQVCLALGLSLEAVALWWMRRIVRSAS